MQNPPGNNEPSAASARPPQPNQLSPEYAQHPSFNNRNAPPKTTVYQIGSYSTQASPALNDAADRMLKSADGFQCQQDLMTTFTLMTNGMIAYGMIPGYILTTAAGVVLRRAMQKPPLPPATRALLGICGASSGSLLYIASEQAGLRNASDRLVQMLNRYAHMGQAASSTDATMSIEPKLAIQTVNEAMLRNDLLRAEMVSRTRHLHQGCVPQALVYALAFGAVPAVMDVAVLRTYHSSMWRKSLSSAVLWAIIGGMMGHSVCVYAKCREALFKSRRAAPGSDMDFQPMASIGTQHTSEFGPDTYAPSAVDKPQQQISSVNQPSAGAGGYGDVGFSFGDPTPVTTDKKQTEKGTTTWT